MSLFKRWRYDITITIDGVNVLHHGSRQVFWTRARAEFEADEELALLMKDLSELDLVKRCVFDVKVKEQWAS
jgi:hypothetical protein